MFRPAPPPTPVMSTSPKLRLALEVPLRSMPSLDAPVPRPLMVVVPENAKVPPPVMAMASSPVLVAL